MKLANVFYATATSGGTLAYRSCADARAADKLIDERLAAPFTPTPTTFSTRGIPRATTIRRKASSASRPRCSHINAADDERNPPETGLMERDQARQERPPALIPASEDTRGHGTTGMAKFYAKELQAFLQSAPRRGPSSN